jgi:hypothetical protein
MEMKKKAETKPKASGAATKTAEKPAAGAKKGGKK